MGTPQGPYTPPAPAPGSPPTPVPSYQPYQPPPTYPSYPAYPMYPPEYSPIGGPATRDAESRAMRLIRIATIIGLVGAVIGFTALFVIPAAEGTSLFGSTGTIPTNSTGAPQLNNSTALTHLANLAYALLGVTVVGVIFELISVYLFREAFNLLKPFDRRFSAPATFCLVLLIGLILEIPGFIAFFSVLGSLATCSSAANATNANNCTIGLLGGLLGALALVAVGGLLAFIGLIGGLVLGSWRLGSRYNSTLFKVGAILLIFFGPLGNALILIDAYSVGKNLEAMPPYTPGGPPSSPPGYGGSPPTTYQPPGYPPPPR